MQMWVHNVVVKLFRLKNKKQEKDTKLRSGVMDNIEFEEMKEWRKINLISSHFTL